jgi:hypothetical protein
VALVKKCLTKDVTKRFQSATELADALRPFASDRTRDSLERMEEAREAPNIEIALQVESLTPPSLDPSSEKPKETIEDGLRDYLAGALEQDDLDDALVEDKPRATPPLPPAAKRTPPPPISTPAIPAMDGLTPPINPASRPSLPASPASLDGGLVSSSQRLAFSRNPSRRAKVMIALGGVLLVVVAFGLLTAMKAIAQSLGGGASEPIAAPAAAPPPPAATTTIPYEPVTAPPRPGAPPVGLDAGRSPP